MMEKTRFFTNKKHRNTALSKVFLICIVMLTLISTISAYDFDNRKEILTETGLAGYNDIKIGNFFGLGKTLWSGTLDSNTEKCSNDCQAIQTITLHEKGSLVDDIIFKTLKNGIWIEQPIRSYQLYIKTGKTPYEVNDYETQCVEKYYLNGSSYQDCKQVKIGSHTEYEIIWGEYNLGTELDIGTYVLKLEGSKKPSRTVDWIYKTQGETLNEWAEWGSRSSEFGASIVNLSIAGDGATSIHAIEIYNEYMLLADQSAYIYKYYINGTFIERFSVGGEMTVPYGVTTDGTNIWVSENVGDAVFKYNWAGTYQSVTSDLTATTATLFGIEMNGSHFFTADNGQGIDRYNSAWTYQTNYDTSGETTNLRDIALDNFTDDKYIWTILYTGGIGNQLVYKYYTNGTYSGYSFSPEISGSTEGIGVNETAFFISTGTTIHVFEKIRAGGTITLNSPVDNYESFLKEIEFNATARMISGITLVNMSLWHNASGTFELNQTNSSIYVGTNSTTFNATFGNEYYLWNIQACDSDGDCAFATLNRTFNREPIKINSETYVNSTTSGATNDFEIELQTDGTIITTAHLHYNNTNYTGSISFNGNNYTLTRSIVAPKVTTSTNISFYWDVTMEDDYNYLTDSQNQLVAPLVINETCGTGMYVIYNLTLVDEITQATLNGATDQTLVKIDLDLYTSNRGTLISEFYHEFNQTNPIGICMDTNLSNNESYSLDLQIQYGATNYSTEFYYIERKTLNSSSLVNNLTLYNLDNTNAQEFKLIVRDSSYLPIGNALIKIERKYIENGTYYITEIPKTNPQGIASASLQLNDVIYNFYIYQSGVLLSSFTDVLAICQTPAISTCEIDFNAYQSGISIPDYETADDFNFTLSYDGTSKVVTSQFVIPSGEPSTIKLEVIKEDTLGTAVCSDTLTSASGTLSCVVPNSFGNATVRARLYKDDVEYGWGNIKLDQGASDIFGVVLIMLSVLVLMTLIGVGVSDNPVVTGVFLFIGMILIVALNIVENTGFVGATATILFLAIAIILVIIKAARRS